MNTISRPSLPPIRLCSLPALLLMLSLVPPLVGCATAPRTAPRTANDLVMGVEKSHRADLWRAWPAFESEITVHFGGREMLNGKVLFDTPVGRSRLELADGTTAVYDGNEAWVAPADAEFPMARFHLLTWPYFVAVPAKLRDPGAHVMLQGRTTVHGHAQDTARLTFEAGVGDAPDDWYLLYVNAETRVLEAMAYIVTYGRPVDEAEKEPHAITYHDFQRVDGVPIPMRWRFHDWSAADGIHGDPLGEVTLRNPRFVSPAPDAFAKPSGAVPAPLPE